MRDVARRRATTQRQPISAPPRSRLAASSSSCSPRGSDHCTTLRNACQRGRSRNLLKRRMIFCGRGAWARIGQARPCRARQILPGCLPAVNHNRPQGWAVAGQRVSGTDLNAMRIIRTERNRGGRDVRRRRGAPRPGVLPSTEEEASRAAAASSALRTVGGIDALIALQGVEDPTERRRHAVKRGRLALDALDELKIGLLGGELTPATLTRAQVGRGPPQGWLRGRRARRGAGRDRAPGRGRDRQDGAPLSR